MKRSHSLSTKWKTAIHEAGHAVVGHLTGTAIDYVTIIPKRGAVGHSSPVRDPATIAARKLWDEATAINRRLVLGNLTERFGGKRGWLLRKGIRRRLWRFDGRTVKPSTDGCGTVTYHGTPAPRALLKRRDDLWEQADAIWKEVSDSQTRKDHVKDLMHTLGGPVADCVFFNAPFEQPRWRKLSKEEHEARCRRGQPYPAYGFAIKWTGNVGAGSDFRSIRRQLKHIDPDNWKEARERYRRKCERLVRKHKTDIERVAKALLRRKTLTGAEVAKLIRQECE